VALVLAGALTMTACGGGTKTADTATGTAGRASAPSALPSYASAREEVAAALVRTAATTGAYTVESADEGSDTVKATMTGVSDPAHRALSGKAQASQRALGSLEITIIGDDLYSHGTMEKNWTHMKLSRAPLAAALGFPAIVSSVSSAGGAILGADRTGPGTFKGTLDPAKVDKAAVVHDAKGTPQAFEATLDARGYVTTLILHVPPAMQGLKPATVTVHITGFGEPVTVGAPAAAEVKEISEDAYRLYGDS
jgi:hypothetical protein